MRFWFAITRTIGHFGTELALAIYSFEHPPSHKKDGYDPITFRVVAARTLARLLDRLGKRPIRHQRHQGKVERIVAPPAGNKDDRLQEVAKFDHQVTGATVAEDGRIFVNFPRWSEDVPVSVAELMKDGTIKAYPNEEWNSWRNLNMASVTPGNHFGTVQTSLRTGAARCGWSIPPLPPWKKTVKDGPKLVQIDLASNGVKRI